MDSTEKNYLWTILFQAYNRNSIMGCSIVVSSQFFLYSALICITYGSYPTKADPSVREARLSNGLVRGHAYTITKVVNFDHRGEEIKLIR